MKSPTTGEALWEVDEGETQLCYQLWMSRLSSVEMNNAESHFRELEQSTLGCISSSTTMGGTQ